MIPHVRRPGRRGLTLLELLMVIAIIGVLVGLLLPALNSGRGAARRSQCINNLKQVGLGLENYLATHGSFPSGVLNPTGPIEDRPAGYHHGWVIQLLPYMEQSGVSKTINPDLSIYDSLAQKTSAVRISSLICPSDPDNPDVASATSYAACHNDVEAPIDSTNRGVFYLNSRVRPEDIPDGLSQTIFVGEKARRHDPFGWASGTRSTLRNTGWPINSPETAGLDRDLADADLDDGTDASRAALRLAVGGFSSGHGGGANFAFGDGSVRWVRQGIDPRLYRLLGDRADGEPVDPGDY